MALFEVLALCADGSYLGRSMNHLLKNFAGLVAVFLAGWGGAWTHEAGLPRESSAAKGVDEIRTQRLVIVDEGGREVGSFSGGGGLTLLRVGPGDEKSTRVVIEAIDQTFMRHARVGVFNWSEKGPDSFSAATLIASNGRAEVDVKLKERFHMQRGLSMETNPDLKVGAVVSHRAGESISTPWTLKGMGETEKLK
jgi:hypothetical protein